MNTTNMKKITIGNMTEEERKDDICKRCSNPNCTGYRPVNVAFDSSTYFETCDDFRSNTPKGNPTWYDEPKPYIPSKRNGGC